MALSSAPIADARSDSLESLVTVHLWSHFLCRYRVLRSNFGEGLGLEPSMFLAGLFV